ncbi:MAG: Flp family type IVb pilin [Phycisphaerae bacterium]|nr:Flp family type IVb pilin [Phycisphaerae bacterium]
MARETIRRLRARVSAFLVDDDGPTATEYAIMLALIVLVSAATIQTIGQRVLFVYENIETAVAAAGM